MNHLYSRSVPSRHRFPTPARPSTREIRRQGLYASIYDEWTDGELDAHAARLNISGHTRMTREELVQVLSGA